MQLAGRQAGGRRGGDSTRSVDQPPGAPLDRGTGTHRQRPPCRCRTWQRSSRQRPSMIASTAAGSSQLESPTAQLAAEMLLLLLMMTMIGSIQAAHPLQPLLPGQSHTTPRPAAHLAPRLLLSARERTPGPLVSARLAWLAPSAGCGAVAPPFDPALLALQVGNSHSIVLQFINQHSTAHTSHISIKAHRSMADGCCRTHSTSPYTQRQHACTANPRQLGPPCPRPSAEHRSSLPEAACRSSCQRWRRAAAALPARTAHRWQSTTPPSSASWRRTGPTSSSGHRRSRLWAKEQGRAG